MINDNRDGAYNLTYNRVVVSPQTAIDNLVKYCKISLYITDDNFDQKIAQLIKEAVYDFERLTASSVFLQNIDLRYEYFKGKNKIPFGPHNAITVGAEFLVEGLIIKSVSGGDGKPLSISINAGYSILPDRLIQIIGKMVESKFKNETLSNDYPSSLYGEIKSFEQIID